MNGIHEVRTKRSLYLPPTNLSLDLSLSLYYQAMGGFNSYKNVIAMVVLQCITASVTLFSKVALSQGLSPLVFVVYRQTIATIIMAPLAFFSRWF